MRTNKVIAFEYFQTYCSVAFSVVAVAFAVAVAVAVSDADAVADAVAVAVVVTQSAPYNKRGA